MVNGAHFKRVIRRMYFLTLSANIKLCPKTAKAPSRLTTRRGFAVFKKGEEFLIKYYPRFLSTNAAAASTSIAGAMLIAGAPVFGFFSPLLSPLEAII